MIDPKIFAELQNRNVITHVGLKSTDFKDLNELEDYGLATQVAADTVYDNIVEDIAKEENLLELFFDAIANGGNAVVPADIELTSPIIIEKDTVINLNGHTLTAPLFTESSGAVTEGDTDSYVFWVKSGKLTINGTGTVVAKDTTYSMAVWANGGDVEINGGTYKNGGDSCDLIYASKTGAVVINDGEFIAAGPASGTEPGTKNLYSALNIKDSNKSTCSISVKGGKFFMFDPANNLSESPVMSFVADGYESVSDGDWFVVKAIEA